jgi:hypothetical protein
MKINLKYLAGLMLLLILILSSGVALDKYSNLNIGAINLFNLTISFAITTIVVLLIYFRGLAKEPREKAMHTFTAVGVKFIIELFIALTWFVLAKKTTPSCLILFFVLYLAFSLYLMFVIINTLKNKSL